MIPGTVIDQRFNFSCLRLMLRLLGAYRASVDQWTALRGRL